MKKILPVILVLLFTLACSLTNAPDVSETDMDTLGTMVALTTAPMLTQAVPATPTSAPPPSAIPTTLTDEELIRQALLAKTGWTDAELDFSMGNNTGTVANGSLKKVGEMSGAAWFAGKDSAGNWVIAYIGQGIPECNTIQGFPFPTDWISHCVDANDNVIAR